jgi:selenocysteine lyase/cysteine desulfurase
MTPEEWGVVREQFPAVQSWTFLNTATFGQLPRVAVEATMRHYAHRDDLACWDFLDWYDDADQTRKRIAELIHCLPEDVAFISNAASALGLLLGGIDWRPGDRVVTLQEEFPNNLYNPALVAGRGVESVEASWEDFWEAVTPRTRLVAFSTVNYSTGFRPPLVEIASRLRDCGVLLYLDGTQSVGALKFDAESIQPTMLAVHGYKWLFSPNGAGFMYVHPDVREWLRPNVIGWRSHREWRRVDNLHHGAPEFNSSAEKYEGGSINFALLYAMDASLQLILKIGPDEIERRVLELAEKARRVLRDLGGVLVSEGSPYYESPIVAACFAGADASALARGLKERRVLVSARHGKLRVSVHLYNNEDDLERLRSELGALLGR